MPQHGDRHRADGDPAVGEPAGQGGHIVLGIVAVHFGAVQQRAKGGRKGCAERVGEERIEAVVWTQVEIVGLASDIEQDGAIG